MEAEFEIAPVSAEFVFGQLAPAILNDLAKRYAEETGIAVKHWAFWLLSNGSSVPVPTQINASVLPPVRAAHLLKQTLEKVSQVEMQSWSEADRFMITTAIAQLKELNSIGFA